MKFLGLDVLINNAGIMMNLAFEKVMPEKWDTLYHVNVCTQFFLLRTHVSWKSDPLDNLWFHAG